MQKLRWLAPAAAWFVGAGISSPAHSGGKPAPAAPPVTFSANLNGFQEVPSVSSPGWGKLLLELDSKTGEIHYRLSYGDLEGADVLFAHVHFGERRTNGGVALFLCTNGAPPAGVPVPPACPPASGGTLEGTLDEADVLGPAAQGIEPGELGELVHALRRGAAYVNVHTELFPNGEIRGQIYRDEPPPPPKPPKPPKKGKGGPPDWAGPPDGVPGPPPWVKDKHDPWDDDEDSD